MRAAVEMLKFAPAIFLCLSSLACWDQDSGGGDAEAEVEEDSNEHPNQNLCDDYKAALCHSFDQCTDTSYAQCRAEVAKVACSKDAPLERCKEELVSDCDELPDDCGIRDISDTSDQQEKCESFIDALCDSYSACGYDRAECISNRRLEIDCARAFTISSNYAACMNTLDGNCLEFLPPVCNSIIMY